LEENAKREKEELKKERQELFQERKRKQAEIKKIELKMLRVKEVSGLIYACTVNKLSQGIWTI
jgi:hypothetical protein